MVMRSSIKDAARRAMSGMSRGTLRKLNSKPYWSEGHVDVMAGETATDVEWVQNYGSVSYPADQDKDDKKPQQKSQKQSGGGGGSPGTQGEQPQGDSAEVVMSYMNGSRSHPIITAIGDRRHQLVEIEQGDVAQHRLKDDRQQVLLSSDGTYTSTREDKLWRVALVPKEQSQQQQGAGPQQAQGQQQKQGKQLGQKSAKDDNKQSDVAIEQNGQTTYSRHGESYASQKKDSDSTIHYEKDKKKSAQSTERHTHIRYKDHRIFNDEDGNFWTSPCIVKLDKHCKEG
jgi:hypothetical protein